MKFEIPLNPITKKNHGNIVMIPVKGTQKKRPIMLPSEAYKKYEALCKEYIPHVEKPIDYPITLKCSFFMGTKRKCDISNLLQAVCDILVKYKLIEDDNYTIIKSFDGTRVFYDKENPRTIVEIIKEV